MKNQKPLKPFYITTTLPYVNAIPHMGHAVEFVRADIIARWKKQSGYEVFFNTGTDEHGLKIFQKAKQMGMDTQAYVDQLAQKFREILPLLGISTDINFVRTTDAHHIMAVQEFWKLVDKNGYIYKKNYSVKYCVGCELEKTDSELVEGKCVLHPLQNIEIINEENYFFKFSAFQDKLLDFYKSHPRFVIPDSRFNEITSFVSRGLEDFSISRLKEKMPWGVSVPGDDTHVMYVWFDALTNYVSVVGWPDDMIKNSEGQLIKTAGSFKKWCVETGGMVQYCGKDNLRQQSAMWQAMLMAAGLPSSQTVIINGFITGEGGVKMSKSLGNTVDPLDIVKEYGTEALRYCVARELSPFEDSPFTAEKFKESYNANLANGLGNLVSRVMKMASVNLEVPVQIPDVILTGASSIIPKEYVGAFDAYNIQQASNVVWQLIADADKIIQESQPFKLIKTDKVAAQKIIADLCLRVYTIGYLLNPIMPETAMVIQNLVKENKMPEQPLFLRK